MAAPSPRVPPSGSVSARMPLSIALPASSPRLPNIAITSPSITARVPGSLSISSPRVAASPRTPSLRVAGEEEIEETDSILECRELFATRKPHERDEEVLDRLVRLTMQLRFFVGLSSEPALHRELVRQVRYEKRAALEDVIKESEVADAFYIILSGSCAVFKHERGAGEGQLAIRTLLAGDSFGEVGLMAVNTLSVRSANVRTQERSELLALPRRAYDRLLRKRHEEQLKAKIDFFRRLPIFQSDFQLSRRRVFDAAYNGVIETYQKDEYIVRQGDDSASGVYFVMSGEVSVLQSERLQHNGREIHVVVETDRLQTLDYFGERAVLHNRKRSSSVVAVSATQIMRLHKTDFLKHIQRSVLAVMRDHSAHYPSEEAVRSAIVDEVLWLEHKEGMRRQLYKRVDAEAEDVQKRALIHPPKVLTPRTGFLLAQATPAAALLARAAAPKPPKQPKRRPPPPTVPEEEPVPEPAEPAPPPAEPAPPPAEAGHAPTGFAGLLGAAEPPSSSRRDHDAASHASSARREAHSSHSHGSSKRREHETPPLDSSLPREPHPPHSASIRREHDAPPHSPSIRREHGASLHSSSIRREHETSLHSSSMRREHEAPPHSGSMRREHAPHSSSMHCKPHPPHSSSMQRTGSIRKHNRRRSSAAEAPPQPAPFSIPALLDPTLAAALADFTLRHPPGEPMVPAEGVGPQSPRGPGGPQSADSPRKSAAAPLPRAAHSAPLLTREKPETAGGEARGNRIGLDSAMSMARGHRHDAGGGWLDWDGATSTGSATASALREAMGSRTSLASYASTSSRPATEPPRVASRARSAQSLQWDAAVAAINVEGGAEAGPPPPAEGDAPPPPPEEGQPEPPPPLGEGGEPAGGAEPPSQDAEAAPPPEEQPSPPEPVVPPLDVAAAQAAAAAEQQQPEPPSAPERLSFRAGDTNRPPNFGAAARPRHISVTRRLNRRPMKFIDLVDQVLILYCDFVHGMDLAGRMPAMAVVALLDRVYTAISEQVEPLGLRKVEAANDALLLVSGLSVDSSAAPDPVAIGDAALAVTRVVQELQFGAPVGPDGTDLPIQIRACVHAGPCIAARQVFGNSWLFYDLWGNVVFDVQRRCDTQCPPNRVMVTPEAAALLSPSFLLEGGEGGGPTLLVERGLCHPALAHAGPPPSAATGGHSPGASRAASPAADGDADQAHTDLLAAASAVLRKTGYVGPRRGAAGPPMGSRRNSGSHAHWHHSQSGTRKVSAALLPDPPRHRTTFTPVPPPPPPTLKSRPASPSHAERKGGTRSRAAALGSVHRRSVRVKLAVDLASAASAGGGAAASAASARDTA